MTAPYRRSILAACLAGAIGLIGCGRDDPASRVAPVYRLVDTDQRAAMTIDYGNGVVRAGAAIGAAGIETVAFPTASIEDETRYVLGSPPRRLLANEPVLVVDEHGDLDVLLHLPPAIARARRILLEPYIKPGRIWFDLPRREIELSAEPSQATLPYTITGLAGFAGRSTSVNVYAYGIDWGTRVSYETGELEIPNGARLEFGYGMIEAGRDAGPVRFALEACRNDACAELFAYELDPTTDAGQRWTDATVSLTDYAGSTVRLRFVTTPVHDTAGAIPIPVWANPTVYAPPAEPVDAPNVILLSVDTLRADHLSVYGHEHTTSPFIDQRFGEDGTVFEHCMAVASTTSPSHMSIFTGLQPTEHGLTTGLERLPRWLYPLGELARAAHIETGAVTEDGWLGAEHGFGRGMNVYAENKSPNIMAPTGQVDVTFARARRWLARNHDKHFFLFLHTFQVHDPYAPPAKYQELFTTIDGEAVTESSPRHQRERVAYDQEIRYTDAQVASLFSELRTSGLIDNTVFILTSDHGEAFGEHGRVRHASVLYEPVLHVPLLLWGRGIPTGLRIPNLVGHVDIAPTILDLLRIAPAHRLSGRSLLPLLQQRESTEERIYFAETWAKHGRALNYMLTRHEPPSIAARLGTTKLIRRTHADAFEYEQYDLAADPHELVDLVATGAPPDPELRRAIDSYLERTRDSRGQLMRAAGAGGGSSAPAVRKLDPQQEEKLRALGYLH